MPDQYRTLVGKALSCGTEVPDRTGIGRLTVLNETLRYDLGKGFPLIGDKYTWYKGVVAELLWFISGDTNIKILKDQGVHIWDAWADENNDLGPVYGAQWNRNGALASLCKNLQDDPYSTRHVISAWNADELADMALPPCHYAWQCNVIDKTLHMTVTMRSADVFLGVPFNVASYATLLTMLARHVGLKAGTLTVNMANAHLYVNHIKKAECLLHQVRRLGVPAFPQLIVKPRLSIWGYELNDFALYGYNPLPKIKAPVAV